MTDMQDVLFVQHGDFREAYQRFSAGAAETYRDQKTSVDFVAALAPERQVTVLTLGSEIYRTELAPGLFAVGMKRADMSAATIGMLMDTVAPSHVILRTPQLGFLQAALGRGCHVLPSFADIFHAGGLKRRWRHFKLRRALSHPLVPCVCNHSLNASRSLVSALGLRATRIVPWDWSRIPMAGPAKASVTDPAAVQLFYAGVLSEEKGVGDVLRALRVAADQGHHVSAALAGPGDRESWRAEAARLGIADQISFLGLIPNSTVRARMQSSDMVIVPSRHNYPEGLPNTIYEALASRSPLILSDHPAFAGRLIPGEQCLSYPAEDSVALAGCIGQLCTDPTLYGRLSQNASQSLDGLYVGLEWTKLIETFLQDPGSSTGQSIA